MDDAPVPYASSMEKAVVKRGSDLVQSSSSSVAPPWSRPFLTSPPSASEWPQPRPRNSERRSQQPRGRNRAAATTTRPQPRAPERPRNHQRALLSGRPLSGRLARAPLLAATRRVRARSHI
eukprot:7382168-Prymnesium_polylepis.1